MKPTDVNLSHCGVWFVCSY